MDRMRSGSPSRTREHTAARFQGLVEASPEAILLLDPVGLVVQANGWATELLGGDPVGWSMSGKHPVA